MRVIDKRTDHSLGGAQASQVCEDMRRFGIAGAAGAEPGGSVRRCGPPRCLRGDARVRMATAQAARRGSTVRHGIGMSELIQTKNRG